MALIAILRVAREWYNLDPQQHRQRVLRRKLADLEADGAPPESWDRLNAAVDNEFLIHLNRNGIPRAYRHAFDDDSN